MVESPAKCKTISKIVGKGYDVLACNGHVRVLPSRKGAVQPERGFAMDFEVNPRSERTLAALRKSAARARAVYLATDPDREGEAIAAHVGELLQPHVPQGTQLRRISFGEVTARAVTEALAAPREIDAQLVAAQKARQAVDYLVGFTMSPMLWKKLPGCKSAGRVQSVALRDRRERRGRGQPAGTRARRRCRDVCARPLPPLMPPPSCALRERWDIDLALGAAERQGRPPRSPAYTRRRRQRRGPPKRGSSTSRRRRRRTRRRAGCGVAVVAGGDGEDDVAQANAAAAVQHRLTPEGCISRLGMGVSSVMRIASGCARRLVGGTQVDAAPPTAPLSQAQS